MRTLFTPILRLATFTLSMAMVSSCASLGSDPTPSPPSADGGADGAAVATPFSSELCAEGFCWVRPTPQGNPLRAVSAVGEEVWAVGDGGTVLRRRDGVWAAAPLLTASSLRAVFGTRPDDVWIAGAGGAVLHFDGARLSVVATDLTATLRGIWASSKSDVWIVAESGAVLHYDGTSFKQASAAPDALHAVWGSGPSDVWAVGGTANVGTIGHFSGGAWSWQASGLSGAGWNAASGTASDDVWITGNYGRVAHYDGSEWAESVNGLGRGEGVAVTAVARGEAYFATREAFFGLANDEPKKFDGVVPGNAFAVSRDGDVTFVAESGGITRGAPPSATVEVAGATETIFAITPEGHPLTEAAGGRIVDLTTQRDVAVRDDFGQSRVLMADDGTVLLKRDPGATVALRSEVGKGNAFAFAAEGRWVDVPNPPSVPLPPDVASWKDGFAVEVNLVAARSKDDVWFFAAPIASGKDPGSPASYRPALLHYVRGAYEMVELPPTCLEEERGRNFFGDAAVRTTPDGVVVGCGCSVARVRGRTLDAPVTWECENPGERGYLSRPRSQSIYLDGDTVYVAYGLFEYAYTGDFVHNNGTPVVSRVAGGRRQRVELPELTSTEGLEVFVDRGPGGSPALYLSNGTVSGGATSRKANFVDLATGRAGGKRLPIGKIKGVFSTPGGIFVSNGTGLLRSR